MGAAAYKTLKSSDPWEILFPQGTVLWRKVDFKSLGKNEFEAQPTLVEFAPTNQENFILTAKIEGSYLWEPEVSSKDSTGLVVFVDTLPDEDWTHLIVMRTSKAMSIPGKPGKGSCVFTKVAKPYDMDSYLTFRETFFDLKTKYKQSDAETVFEAARSVQIPDFRTGEKRLLVQQNWGDEQEYMYYRHLCR